MAKRTDLSREGRMRTQINTIVYHAALAEQFENLIFQKDHLVFATLGVS